MSPELLDQIFLPPPAEACHYCHNPPARERQVGPGKCGVCHDVVEPPTNHGSGWLDLHGAELRVGAMECDDCHRSTFCIDCHTRKERITFRVHDRTWVSVHGIASRTDPTSCGSCHLQADCQDCHATADGRVP